MDEQWFLALIQRDGADDEKITRIMRRGGLTRTSTWTILRQVPETLEASNNVAILCSYIDVSLLEKIAGLAACSNRRLIVAHKDPLPMHSTQTLCRIQQLAFTCMYSIATRTELDTFLDEIGLGVKTESKEDLVSRFKDVYVEECKQQGHVAGDPHGAKTEALTSVVASIPSRCRASQSSAGRGLDQHGQGGGANQHSYAPGDVKISVKLDNERRYPPQKPVILFNLNGTLTSHTFRGRRRQGRTCKSRFKIWPRPGMHHLRKLLNYFKLGIYSSSKDPTVKSILPMLEEAAGDGARIFRNPELILHRGHTQTAPQDHTASGGNDWEDWDTVTLVKPLSPYFGRMHQVLLVDHDDSKAVPQERQNMILIPYWEKQPRDLDTTDLGSLLEELVNAILRTLDGTHAQTDLRKYTSGISAALAPVQEGSVHTSRK